MLVTVPFTPEISGCERIPLMVVAEPVEGVIVLEMEMPQKSEAEVLRLPLIAR
jgi:hypothetical protein